MLNFLGWLLIPVGLLFTHKVVFTAHPYRDHPELGNHELELLPNWSLLRPHQNLWDGVNGDKRGWYHNKFKSWPKFLRQWWWLAFRNPLNTQKRVLNAFDISRCVTELVSGKPYLDEDEGIFGESLIRAQDIYTGEIYESYQKMKKLPFGFYVLWKHGHKFSLGEEKIPFPDTTTELNYENVKALTAQYARDGYHKGNAMLTLDRLIPKTGRYKWFFTLKKIKD